VSLVEDGALAGRDAGARSPRTSAPRRRAVRGRDALVPVATVVLLAVAWEVVGRSADLLYLPPFSAVAERLWELTRDGTIPSELGASVAALGAGMAISVVAGVVLGVLMGLFPLVRQTLDVYVDALLTAPVIAFVPLFILLFGLGFQTRIAACVLFALPPIVVNTMAGVRSVDPDLVSMGRSFGASRWQLFWQVRLPMASGHVEAGLRMGVARGVDGVITGEVLIAAVGLGGLVSRFGNSFTMDRLDAVVAVIIVLVLVSVGVVRVLGWLARGRRPARV
jgi:NitT/TauT family transport system permease protein